MGPPLARGHIYLVWVWNLFAAAIPHLSGKRGGGAFFLRMEWAGRATIGEVDVVIYEPCSYQRNSFWAICKKFRRILKYCKSENDFWAITG